MNKNNQAQYADIDTQKLEQEMIAIKNCWENFFGKLLSYYYNKNNKNKSKLQYSVCVSALSEIVQRVHQRKDYFLRYHSNMIMSEYKEIGLNMFWITKLKPFNITGFEYDDTLAFNINEEFAMFYMLSSLERFASDLKLTYNSDKLSNKLYNEMLYSLCFRDIPKEALGVIVELVANVVIENLPVE